MFASLSKKRIEAVPILLADLERLVARLPAKQRAALIWSPEAVRKALLQLHREPLSRMAVAEVGLEVFRSFHRCWPLLMEFLRAPEVLRAELSAAWQEKVLLLRSAVVDPAVADAAEWAFRSLSAFFDFFLSVAANEVMEGLPAFDERELERTLTEDGPGCIFRTQVLLMAILEGAAGKMDSGRAEELAVMAFMEASSALNALAREGIRLDPFRGETSEQRTRRILRYSEFARGSLSDEALEVLASARVHGLR
ncbi:MAG: hypothetical protein FJ109_18325 [Deltaproteobacteria bacterium]|nr:hypothetical protein [Deltaproteobacteria bacterium]